VKASILRRHISTEDSEMASMKSWWWCGGLGAASFALAAGCGGNELTGDVTQAVSECHIGIDGTEDCDGGIGAADATADADAADGNIPPPDHIDMCRTCPNGIYPVGDSHQPPPPNPKDFPCPNVGILAGTIIYPNPAGGYTYAYLPTDAGTRVWTRLDPTQTYQLDGVVLEDTSVNYTYGPNEINAYEVDISACQWSTGPEAPPPPPGVSCGGGTNVGYKTFSPC
jgi:hypothetical protein